MPPSHLKSFSRSQVSAAVATFADWAVLFLLTEAVKVWYVVATAIGALVGAITNFILNRHWSFEAADRHLHHQALRYSVVSVASLALNTWGVWFITEHAHLHYAVSVFLVSALIGVLFNYPLHRFYVYR